MDHALESIGGIMNEKNSEEKETVKGSFTSEFRE